jgi:hypothetical protein
MTAPPTRLEATNPALHGLEFSIGITFRIRSFPACVTPFRFTRSYSERCVSRCVLGNENELTCSSASPGFDPATSWFNPWSEPSRTTSVQEEVFHRKPGEDFSKGKIPAIYCVGDSAGVSSAPAGDSVVVAGASVAAGLVKSVAAGAVVGAGVVTGATVSVFCSHAARSAAPARMQMYFFIIWRRIML